MSTLKLTLKKKWFDMILSGEKKEEYREIKHYWMGRLTSAYFGQIGGDIMDRHKVVSHNIKSFDTIIFKNGYAANAPTIEIECLGIDVGEAAPRWSDNWEGDVFRIKLGKILRTENIK